MLIDLDPVVRELPWGAGEVAAKALAEVVLPQLGPRLAVPHRLYVAGSYQDLSDLENGVGPETGWRYLVVERGAVLASIDVSAPITSKPSVLGTSVGGNVTQVDEIIAYAEKKLMPRRGIYELRCIMVPPLHLEIVWFHFKFDKEDPDAAGDDYGVILDGTFVFNEELKNRHELLKPFAMIKSEIGRMFEERGRASQPASLPGSTEKPKKSGAKKAPKGSSKK